MPLDDSTLSTGGTRRPRVVRRTARLGLALALLAMVVPGVQRAAVAYSEERVRDELIALGLADAELTVESIDLERLVLKDVRLGEDASVRRIELRYGAGELIEGRVDEVLVEGLRWEIPHTADPLARSSIARLLASSARSGAEPAVRSIRVRDARLVDANARSLVELEGHHSPVEGRGRFEARSARGHHRVTIRHWRESAATLVAVDARSVSPATAATADAATADPATRDALSARVRIPDDDSAIALRASARLGPIDARVGGHRASSPSVSARVRATVRGDAIEARVRARSSHLEVGELASGVGERVAVLRDVRATMSGRVTLEGAAIRLRAGAMDLRAASASVGRGDRAVRMEGVSVSAEPRSTAPLLSYEDGRARIEARVGGEVQRVGGAVEAARVRFDAPLELALGEDGPRGSAEVRVDADRVRDPEGWMTLAEPRLTLPVQIAREAVSARGRLDATSLSVRDHAFGPARGTVEGTDAGARLRISCALGGGGRGEVALDLAPRGGAIDVNVPRASLRPDDALSALLLELTGVRITGSVGGTVHAPLGDGPARARITLRGARVERDGTSADGARGVLDFASLSPVESARPARIEWSALRVAGVAVGDRGSAWLRAHEGGLDVDRFEIAAGGGRIRLSPFRHDPSQPALSLHGTARDLDLSRILGELTGGRAAGEGRVDAELSLELRDQSPRRVRVGAGRVVARGPGHFRIGDAAMLGGVGAWAAPLSGSVIARRLVGALSDLDYSALEIVLAPRAPRPVVAHVVGRGRTVPQDVDVTLRFQGLQQLLDEVLRIRDASVTAPPETS